MKPEYIVLHTAAHERTDVDAAEIDRWHQKRGFERQPEYLARRPGQLAHIGYHYVIQHDGTREACRYEDEPGAHCASGGMNRRSLGICLTGHGDVQPWTSAQRDELLLLLRELYARHPRIAIGGSWRLVGHGEVPGAGKSCPGRLINMHGVRAWCDEHIIPYVARPVRPMPLQPLP